MRYPGSNRICCDPGGSTGGVVGQLCSGPECDHGRVGAQDLTTNRLRLDGPVPADVAGVFAILSDSQTVVHNPSDLLTHEVDASELVARWICHWDEHGLGYWCAPCPWFGSHHRLCRGEADDGSGPVGAEPGMSSGARCLGAWVSHRGGRGRCELGNGREAERGDPGACAPREPGE